MTVEWKQDWNDWQVYPPRPAWVEVDRSAIVRNTRRIRDLAKPATLMGVVKADGFGHGLVESARAMLEGGATQLGVAIPEEGIALRRSGISAPILVLGTIPPRLAETVVQHDLAVALCTAELAETLDAEGARQGRPARVHVKVDTGVRRIGLPPDETVSFMRKLRHLHNLLVEGVFSVLVDDIESTPFARCQHGTFLRLLDAMKEENLCPPLAHLSNSVPLVSHPEMALDMVRVARLLFGITPWQPGLAAELGLRPALAIRCEVVFVKWVAEGESIGFDCANRIGRDTRVVTLPLGFADVGRFLHGDRGFVLLRGRPAPVLEIASDQTLVDATAIPDAAVGDTAVLLGKQESARITVLDAMLRTGLSGGTLCTGLSRRLAKVYLRDGKPYRLQGYLESGP